MIRTFQVDGNKTRMIATRKVTEMILVLRSLELVGTSTSLEVEVKVSRGNLNMEMRKWYMDGKPGVVKRSVKTIEHQQSCSLSTAMMEACRKQ